MATAKAEEIKSATNTATGRRFVRIKGAAAHYDLSESYLRHALCDGTLKGYKLSGNVFLDLDELDEKIANGKMK